MNCGYASDQKLCPACPSCEIGLFLQVLEILLSSQDTGIRASNAAQPVLTAKGALVQGSLAADIVMWKNVRLGRTPESQKEREASVAFLNVAESVLKWRMGRSAEPLSPRHLSNSLTKSIPPSAMCAISIQRDFELLTPLHHGA